MEGWTDEALIQAVKSEIVEIHKTAIKAMKGRKGEATNTLVKALKSDNREIAEAAAKALTGKGTKTVISALLEVSKKNVLEVWEAAIKTLASTEEGKEALKKKLGLE